MATPNDQKAAPKDQRATPVGDFNTQHQSGAQWQHQRAASKGNTRGQHQKATAREAMQISSF